MLESFNKTSIEKIELQSDNKAFHLKIKRIITKGITIEDIIEDNISIELNVFHGNDKIETLSNFLSVYVNPKIDYNYINDYIILDINDINYERDFDFIKNKNLKLEIKISSKCIINFEYFLYVKKSKNLKSIKNN